MNWWLDSNLWPGPDNHDDISSWLIIDGVHYALLKEPTFVTTTPSQSRRYSDSKDSIRNIAERS